MKIFRYIIASTALLLSAFTTPCLAQEVENVAQYRIGVEMDWKLFNVKGLKMSFEPQIRRGSGFSHESLTLETGLRYKTLGFLYWGANYRLTVEPSDVDFTTNKYGRYALSLTAKEDFGRFTPSLRVQYSNYTDEDVDDKKYLRYRAKLDYNIRKCPVDPYILVELYQDLSENLLSKARYGVGVDYKIKKDNYLNFNYKLDYYTLKYKNRHIFSLGYKVGF